MKRFFTIIGCILLSAIALSLDAQVTNGTYRALTDANSARVVALGGLPMAIHDGDLQTATFNPSTICPSMNNQ